MKEEGRNSLLKLLEEPPEGLTLVLCSSRPEALLPTVLSRLRPYRFYARDQAVEEEVLHRVFRVPGGNVPSGKGGLLKAFLDSYLPVPGDTLDALAAFFIAAVCRAVVLSLEKWGSTAIPGELVTLQNYGSSVAEAAGLPQPPGDCKAACAGVMEGASGFEVSSLFSRFLEGIQAQLSAGLRGGLSSPGGFSPFTVTCLEIWRIRCAQVGTAVSSYNQNCTIALERLFIETVQDLSNGRSPGRDTP
jgi:DNA polymerase-3 subunit gamma/tau